jgi:branched-chain amino acid transport system substrate-binding protein
MHSFRTTARRILAVLATVCGTAFGSLGWSDTAHAGDANGVDADSIRLGMVNAQSGPASALGQGMLAGAQAVFKDVNARGGVHGRKIVLRVADDGYEPEQTVEQTLRMVQHEKVFALFGFVGTPTVNAVLPLLGELEVPLVGVFSGANSLRKPVTRQLFNVRASYDDEAEALIAHLIDADVRKVAVVYQNDGFGIAVLSAVDKALKRGGLRLHASASFQRNTVAIRMALGTMLEQQPEAIVLAGPYVPVAAFIQQARAMGLKSRFATVSFVGTESLLARLGDEGQGTLISQVVPLPMDTDLAIAEECRALLKLHAGDALGFVSFEGCISARLLVAALQRAGPQLTRSALISSLETLGPIDLGGLRLHLSAQDHQASNTVFLTEVVDGRIKKLR